MLAAMTAQVAASSIEALAPGTNWPSIVKLGEEATIDPSIVAATPVPAGPSPSILVLADTPPDALTSIVSLGTPEAGESQSSSQRASTPVVIRGGEAGDARPEPSGTSAPAQSSAPLLDPNDRGTPAKRKALKQQEERLAKQRALSQEQDNAPVAPGS